MGPRPLGRSTHTPPAPPLPVSGSGGVRNATGNHPSAPPVNHPLPRRSGEGFYQGGWGFDQAKRRSGRGVPQRGNQAKRRSGGGGWERGRSSGGGGGGGGVGGGLGDGQPDAHDGALAFAGAARPDAAAVLFDDVATDIQAQPHAGDLPLLGVAGAAERLEDALGGLARQADAAIRDLQQHAARLALHPQ